MCYLDHIVLANLALKKYGSQPKNSNQQFSYVLIISEPLFKIHVEY